MSHIYKHKQLKELNIKINLYKNEKNIKQISTKYP